MRVEARRDGGSSVRKGLCDQASVLCALAEGLCVGGGWEASAFKVQTGDRNQRRFSAMV